MHGIGGNAAVGPQARRTLREKIPEVFRAKRVTGPPMPKDRRESGRWFCKLLSGWALGGKHGLSSRQFRAREIAFWGSVGKQQVHETRMAVYPGTVLTST
jgi:hypothetical protein